MGVGDEAALGALDLAKAAAVGGGPQGHLNAPGGVYNGGYTGGYTNSGGYHGTGYSNGPHNPHRTGDANQQWSPYGPAAAEPARPAATATLAAVETTPGDVGGGGEFGGGGGVKYIYIYIYICLHIYLFWSLLHWYVGLFCISMSVSLASICWCLWHQSGYLFASVCRSLWHR